MAVYALSRESGAEIMTLTVITTHSNILYLVKLSYEVGHHLIQVVQQLQQDKQVFGYSLQDGLLRKAKKLVVRPD